ncbi:MAG: ABC transporter ATP-binding protein [Eubacteriaceae bacterium]|nr:ABC transporter ATP-binding protein [Eubacteriaceae bacterium]
MGIAISVRNASFSYVKGTSVWENISLDVYEGDCLCLLGSNGSGKTTLFNCMCGNLALTSGEIIVNGKNIRDYRAQELALALGAVFQEHSAPFPYSSLEVVRMGRAPHLGFLEMPSPRDTEIAYQAMSELGIEYLANESYTKISGGERQLVLIARALCQGAKTILFDEPTSHLDLKNQASVLSAIKALSLKGMTILFVSHSPEQAFKVGTKAVVLGGGGILAQGRVDEAITEASLSAAYGIEMKMYEGGKDGEMRRFFDTNAII